MANLQEQYDAVFLGILQNEGQLVNFLDKIFSFLHRRTDFYVEMTTKTDKMGFPPGVAKHLVLQVFKKYEDMANRQKENQMRLLEKAKAMQMEDITETYQEYPPTSRYGGPNTRSSCTYGTSTSSRSNTHHKLDMESTQSSENRSSRFSCDVPKSSQKPKSEDIPPACSTDPSASSSTTATGSDSIQTSSPDLAEKHTPSHEAAASNQPSSEDIVSKRQKTSESGDVSNKMDTDDDDADLTRQQKIFQENPDSYNGAIRDKYSWSQSITDLDVKIFVPPEVTKGKHLQVNIQRKHLTARYQAPSGEWRVIVDGELTWEINKEESMWSLEPGKAILVNLEKVQERWWEAILADEPKINVRKIDPSRPMASLDDEAQAKIEEMMYNERQKQLGLPQSHESKVHDMLKKAWDADGSPFKGQPFDPSKVNVAPPNSQGLG